MIYSVGIKGFLCKCLYTTQVLNYFYISVGLDMLVLSDCESKVEAFIFITH